MNTENGWLTAGEMVVQLGENAVTAWQIEAWHKKGLLTRPRHIRLGKGRGTESRYPPRTLDQIRAILKLKREKHIRRLADIPVWLWLEGYPIKIDLIKKELYRAAKWLKPIQVKSSLEVPQKIEQARMNDQPQEIFGVPISLNEKIEGILFLVIQLMSDIPTDFNPDLYLEDMKTAIELERIPGLGQFKEDAHTLDLKWMQGPPGDYIQGMSKEKILSLGQIYKSIDNLSEERLEKARVNLKKLIDTIYSLRVLSKSYGYRFGFSKFRKIIEWGEKNIGIILLALYYFEYKNLSVDQVLPGLLATTERLQNQEPLDQDQQARVNRKIRRKIDSQ